MAKEKEEKRVRMDCGLTFQANEQVFKTIFFGELVNSLIGK